MTELRLRRRGALSTDPVDEDNPLPVSMEAAEANYGNEETLTVSTIAKSLTATEMGDYTLGFITVEAAPVRYWVSGTLPTASVGHQLSSGDVLTLEGRAELTKFRVIRRDGADATLRVSYGL